MKEVLGVSQIPELWKFPERTGFHGGNIRDISVDEPHRYLSFTVQGRDSPAIEYFFGDDGGPSARHEIDEYGFMSVTLWRETGLISFDWDPDLSFERLKVDFNKRMKDFRPMFPNICFTEEGKLSQINKGNFFNPRKDRETLLVGANAVVYLPPFDYEILMLRENKDEDVFFDKFGRYGLHFPRHGNQAFRIEREDEQKIIARSADGDKSFGYEWEIRDNFFVLKETYLQREATKILKVPLRVDMVKVLKVMSSKPPYPAKDGELDVPWRGIDGVIGLGIGYHRSIPANPQENEV